MVSFGPPFPLPVITVVSLERLDYALLYQAFPFDERIPIIEFRGPGGSLEQITPALWETDILVVATQHLERDRYTMEALSGAAQKAFLKLVFSPHKATVHGFTNQVCYSKKFGALSAPLGRFLGLIVSAEQSPALI